MAGGKVGLIGLGAMGLGIAGTLRNKGHEVHACDARDGVAQSFAAQGGVACSTPSEVARVCDVVVSVVVNAAQTEAVLYGEGRRRGSDAAGQASSSCARPSIPTCRLPSRRAWPKPASTTSMRPSRAAPPRRASGQMTMMTSARPEAYAAVATVLDDMAGKVYRLGDRAGIGSKVKIINQLLAGVHIAAAAEAMALGLREGVDAAALYDVITHSAGNSWMFENRMAHVIAADYTPLSAVDIFVKDLGLVLDTARASKFPLPLASTAHQMFMQGLDGRPRQGRRQRRHQNLPRHRIAAALIVDSHHPAMPKFAANLSMLYNELDFLDRFEAAAADGFTAVEYLFPYAFDKHELAARLRANGLQQVLFNGPPGKLGRRRARPGLPARNAKPSSATASPKRSTMPRPCLARASM